MVNLAQAWAEEYRHAAPNVSVEVSGGGSGVGIAALIKGTIDRIDRAGDGKVDVLDYKMGFDGMKEEDAAGSLQLSIYALGAERGLGLPRDPRR